MFAETRPRGHETYCLRRADVTPVREQTRLSVTQWSTTDHDEVRFRRLEGDQLRKGAVGSHVPVASFAAVGDGCDAVDLIMESLSYNVFLPSPAPLAAFDIGHGRWSMWAQQQATAALRSVVGLAGGHAEDYALHSLTMGGATHLSAGVLHQRSCNVMISGSLMCTRRIFAVTGMRMIR